MLTRDSIAEMRDPAEYRKPIAAAMGLLGACYLSISLVVYRYCGVFIASPALGSAGPLIKKVTYGIALPGLLISASLCQHVSHGFPFRLTLYHRLMVTTVGCEIPFCPDSERNGPSTREDQDPLGDLDRNFSWKWSVCLYHLRSGPFLWESNRIDRCSRIRSHGGK